MLVDKGVVVGLVRDRVRVLEGELFGLRVSKDFGNRFWQLDGGLMELKGVVSGVEKLVDPVWNMGTPMPVDYTCCCGKYVHPSRRDYEGIHLDDCPYRISGVVDGSGVVGLVRGLIERRIGALEVLLGEAVAGRGRFDSWRLGDRINELKCLLLDLDAGVVGSDEYSGRVSSGVPFFEDEE